MRTYFSGWSFDVYRAIFVSGLVPLGETQPPKFAFDVVLGENSVINYGSYANRLRPRLQQFFFPNDYVVKAVTSAPGPGEKRIFTRFDVSFSLSSEADFYLLFSNKGTPQHLKISVGPPSKLIIHTPLTTSIDGYSSTIQGDLSGVKVSSSLDYPSLGQADSVSFLVDLHFPRVWNATQTWDMRFTGRNAQVNILFSYIDYVNGKHTHIHIQTHTPTLASYTYFQNRCCIYVHVHVCAYLDSLAIS